jgi:hypothetical protein
MSCSKGSLFNVRLRVTTTVLAGIASKETVLRVHLAKAFGDKRLDEISTEDVRRLKAALVERAPKTVNNVLTVLSVVRTAVEWGVIARVPCSIKLLKAPKGQASFHDFDEFDRLVEVARSARWPTSSSCSAARLGCAAARSWHSNGPTSISVNGS